jgi:hypothetical protein
MRQPVLALVFAILATPAFAQTPQSDRTGVEIQEVAVIPQTNNQHPVRIAQNPADE